MSSESMLPAYAEQFLPQAIRELSAAGPLAEITPDWAWGGSTGVGIKVAVIDSGIEWDHPAVGGMVRGGLSVEYDENTESKVRFEDDEHSQDLSGHGTACAGIIHSLAPEAELYSVRVLGRDMHGRAIQFANGLDWAVEHDMQVANLSLSTSRLEYYGMFHELADNAYFKNVVLVSAVNNIRAPSFPSQYSSVISVAAHAEKDPLLYYYNPSPPVEFGAPGIDVRVAWKDRAYASITGNSFAAPHIAGIVTLIRAKHPELTPFQVKSVLWACAANVRRESR